MMTATSWMDAKAALADGIIDGIAESASINPANAMRQHAVDRTEAEAKVKAWLDRRKQQPSRPEKGDEPTSFVPPADGQASQPEAQGGTAQTIPEAAGSSSLPGTPLPTEQPENPGTPIAQLQKRLGLLMPSRRKKQEDHQ